MYIWDVGEVQRILEMSFVQKVILLKPQGRICGQEEQLPGGCEEWLIIHLGVGGAKGNGRCPKGLSSAKDPRMPGALATAKLK